MVKAAIQFPAYCYSILPSNEQLIRIDRYESGYNAVTKMTKHVFGEDAKTLANELNKAGDISHAVRSAMEHGSMFGWETPGADPSDKLHEQAAAL